MAVYLPEIRQIRIKKSLKIEVYRVLPDKYLYKIGISVIK